MYGVTVADLDGNSHLYTWGNNEQGELWDWSTNSKNIPTEINLNRNETKGDEGIATNISLISSTVLVTNTQNKDGFDNHHLYLWGLNNYGDIPRQKVYNS